MVEAGKPVVAAFDFDGTLTRRETLLPFLLYTLGTAAVARRALALSPTLAGYGLGLINNGIAKERVFVRCFAGMEMKVLQQEGERFAALVLPGLLRQEALHRLEWHKQQGHRCVVISASLELYVRPWAQKAGFDDVIATQLETLPDGRISGRLAGKAGIGPPAKPITRWRPRQASERKASSNRGPQTGSKITSTPLPPACSAP